MWIKTMCPILNDSLSHTDFENTMLKVFFILIKGNDKILPVQSTSLPVSIKSLLYADLKTNSYTFA